jgi:hypothetical protein
MLASLGTDFSAILPAGTSSFGICWATGFVFGAFRFAIRFLDGGFFIGVDDASSLASVALGVDSILVTGVGFGKRVGTLETE